MSSLMSFNVVLTCSYCCKFWLCLSIDIQWMLYAPHIRTVNFYSGKPIPHLTSTHILVQFQMNCLLNLCLHISCKAYSEYESVV